MRLAQTQSGLCANPCFYLHKQSEKSSQANSGSQRYLFVVKFCKGLEPNKTMDN